MLLLSRNGHPLLYLPADARLRAHALRFYQPQSAKARLFVALLRAFNRLRLPLPLSRSAPETPSDPAFRDFLAQCAGMEDPEFALLCGNPNAPGRRFLLLLFSQVATPACVIKFGTTPEAQALIRREADFLQDSGGTFAGLPQILDSYQSASVSAFAVPYFTGRQAKPQDFPSVVRCLESWIPRGAEQPLREIPGWQRLLALPNCPQELQRVADSKVRPSLYHGDFTPWNLRISSAGDLQVFDWERGEHVGVPGWDWLHYCLQPEILVRNSCPTYLLQLMDRILRSTEWLEYLRRARAAEMGSEIAKGYLWYHLHVCRQTEGEATLRQLTELF
jgi:hypothetical protein